MADITIVNGVYKPTYDWGAPSCGKRFDVCQNFPDGYGANVFKLEKKTSQRLATGHIDHILGVPNV